MPYGWYRGREENVNKFDLRPDASGGFDFVVDGKFVRELVFAGEDLIHQNITLLRRGIFDGAIQEQLGALKGELPGKFFPERVWLYFCPQCYDEGCGGVSVKIHVGVEHVVWSDFRYDGEADTDEESQWFEEEDSVKGVGPFTFDRAEYEAALNRTADQLSRAGAAFWRSTAELDQVSLGLEHLVSRRKQRKSPLDPKEGLQWTIDGRPLWKILDEAGEKTTSQICTMQSSLRNSVVQEQAGDFVEQGRNIIRILLGEELGNEVSHRVPLFVGASLDILSGAITTRVQRHEQNVIWSDFRIHSAGSSGDVLRYSPGLIFTFNRQQHDAVLKRILESV